MHAPPSRREAKPDLLKMLCPHSLSFQISIICYSSSCKATDGKQKNGCEDRNQTRMMEDWFNKKS